MIRKVNIDFCKSVFTAVMLLVVVTSVDARQLTPDAALARFKGSKGTHVAKTATKQPKLIGTQKKNGLSTMFLFNQPDNGGFVILSADDVAPAVLAYSDCGNLDITNLPPAMEEWMDEYSQVISTASKQGRILKATTSNSNWEPIAPMLTTIWGQGNNAYNLYCPLIDENDTTQHRVVGCAATAMGQIMNFWEWPKQGKGSHSYTTSTDNLSISADFNVTYDWDKMADEYLIYKTVTDDSGNEVQKLYRVSGITLEQRQAVSLLLFHAGAAINMNYKQASSAAVSSYYVKATNNNNICPMVEYFSYDKRLKFIQRTNYSDDNWHKLIYHELSLGRPIYYAAHTTKGEGHAFVCDGYEFNDNDYFHFNWGWNGRADGYFLISGDDPLHPSWQGTGGAESGYGFSQSHAIIIGIQPNTTEYLYCESSPYITESGSTVPVTEPIAGQKYRFNVNMCNGCINSVTYYYGVEFYNVTTGESTYLRFSSEHNLASDSIVNSFAFNWPSDLADGTYKVYPCYRTSKSDTKLTRVELPYDADVQTVTIDNDAELTYGQEYNATESKEYKTLKYNWTVYKNVWNSWFVPFAITTTQLADNGISEAAVINAIRQYDTNNDGYPDKTDMEIMKITNAKLRAGVPYLVKPTSSYKGYVAIADGVTLEPASNKTDINTETAYAKYIFKGTYSKITEGAVGNFYIMNNAGGLQTTNSYVPAIDWYMTIEAKPSLFDAIETNAKVETINIYVIGEEDETTGIRTIYPQPIDGGKLNAIYNINGIRTNTTTKGINIINGKKYIIR